MASIKIAAEQIFFFSLLKVEKEQAEYLAQVKARIEGVKDPHTLEQYYEHIRMKQQDGKSWEDARREMTLEQREEFDRLSAEASRSQRKPPVDRGVSMPTQTTGGQIIATKHTKKGHDLFVVKLEERVSREDYKALLGNAKRLGGYYSSYRAGGAVPGFQFTERENAEAFLKLAMGDKADAVTAMQAERDAYEDDRSQTAVQRLETMAAKLDDDAETALNTARKVNTAKRARQAAAADADAYAKKALAKTMRNIADGLKDGRLKWLDRVREKKQVEELTSALYLAKHNENRALYDNYTEQEKHENDPATSNTVEYADFPQYRMFRSEWGTLGRKLMEIDGAKMIGKKIQAAADDVSDRYKAFARENLDLVSSFRKKSGGAATFKTREGAERAISVSGYRGEAIVLQVKRGDNRIIMSPEAAQKRGIWKGDDDMPLGMKPELVDEVVDKLGATSQVLPWKLGRIRDHRRVLARMGIETPAEYRMALREFISLQEDSKPDKIRELEREAARDAARNRGYLDFFPTPAAVTEQMLDVARLEPGQSVLEPSAGMGHIADRIRERGVEPQVVEMEEGKRNLLEAKGYEVVGTDFMQSLSGEEKYDRIIMNPPFSKRQDTEHVRHAYDLLKPGGRLVAVVSEGSFFGSDKKAVEFREWLDNVGGTSERLPEGSFQDKSLPTTTGVNTRMVVIQKEDDAPLASLRKDPVAAPYREQLVDAGYSTEQAEAYGAVLAANARQMAPLFGMSPAEYLNKYFAGYKRADESELSDFYQPLNDDVDLNQKVQIVSIEPRFEGKKPWELVKGKVASELRKSLPGTYHNKATGWDIHLSSNGVSHSISSATQRGLGGTPHMEAVANLPQLIESAVLVETHEDKKGQGLKAVHRMYVPMKSGRDTFAVKLTVKEADRGMVAELEEVLRLYDVSLEKKMPGDRLVPPPDSNNLDGSAAPAPSISVLSLRELLEGIKDNNGVPFFTAGEAEARNVQARAGMPFDERRTTLASKTEDVAREDQIVLYQMADMADAQEVATAEAKLAEDAQAWGKTVDDFMAGKVKARKPVTMLNRTPLVLTLLGADKNLRVETTYATLKKVLVDKHKLPVEVLKQVPEALTRPVMIFDSATVGGDYVVMLDLKDENGATVVVPVSLNYDGIGGYTVNYVPSVYAKNEEGGTAKRWVGNALNDGRLRYQDTKKAAAWRLLHGLQLPGVGSHPANGKKRIYTQNDLGKLKETYPDFYQTTWYGSPAYQRRADQMRGSMSRMPDGRYVVSLFQNADASTVLHETAHFWAEQLRAAHKYETAPEWVHEAWEKLQRAYDFTGNLDGLNEVSEWVRVQERFARDFEAYAREGKAPSPELKTAFQKFKEWLKSIYQSVRDLLGHNPLQEEVREVFDRLLATPEQVAASERGFDGMQSRQPGEFLPPSQPKKIHLKTEAIQRVVDDLNAKAPNAAPVRVVQSMADLPASIREKYAETNGTRLEGVYDPRSGVVYLVADSLSDAGRVAEVWMHEQVVHHGLRSMLSDGERRNLLSQLWLNLGGMGNPLIREIADRYGIDPRKDADKRLIVMEEVLAHLAEKRQLGDMADAEKSWWQKVVAAVAKVWRKIVQSVSGRTAQMDMEEIDHLLTSLGRYVMGGEQGRVMSSVGLATAEPAFSSISQDAPLASLSARDIISAGIKRTANMAKAPEIRHMFKESDLSLLDRMLNLPHWIAKKYAEFRNVYERQIRRMDEHKSALKKSIEQVPSLFSAERLKGKELEKLKELVWEIDGTEPKELKDVDKFLTADKLPSGRETIKVNPAFYTKFERWLNNFDASPAVKKALLEIRKSLDNDMVLAHNRMAEMSDIRDDDIRKFRQTFGYIPNYFPHHRYGNYFIQAKVDGKVVYRQHFDALNRALAKRKAQEIAASLADQYPDAEWFDGKNDKLPDEVLGAPIDTEAMEQIIRSATSRLDDKAQAGKIADILMEGVADVLKTRGWGAHGIKRQNIPGFEKEDIARVLYDYKAGLNGWLTKMEAAKDFSEALSKIDAHDQPRLWEYTSQYVKDMLRNFDYIDRMAGNIKAVAFVWYLGGSIKTAAVNATQNPMVGVPRLQMDVTGGAGLWLKSAGDALVNQLTGSKGKRLTAEENEVLHELYGESVITDAYMTEVRGRLRGFGGATVWNKLTEFLGIPMSIMEQHNRASLALAAFRAARSGKMKAHARERYGIKEKNASYEQAKQFASDIVRDSHFVYGKSNLPEQFRSTTVGRAVAPMYTYRNFSHNLLGLWGWALAQHNKEGAAFVAKSLGMYIVMGGLTSIPFYATAQALYQLVSGDDDDWTEEIREALPESDMLRDVACYGIPSLAGVNIGGSLKLETPVTDGMVRGGTPGEVFANLAGSIIGVPYSLFWERPTKIMEAARHDDTWRMIEEGSPTALQNAMRAWRLYNKGQTTMSGRPINDPGVPGARKLSGLEAVGKAFGFQPVSSTKSYDAYAAQKHADKVRNDKVDELTVLMLKSHDTGEPEGRAEAIRQLKEWNRKMEAEKKVHMRITLKDVMRRVKARRRENRLTAKSAMRKAHNEQVWQ